MKSRVISVKGTDVTIATRHEQDYISLTDMVRNFDGGSALIEQWLKNKDTVLFLGVWEQLNNPSFNSLEFEGIRNGARLSLCRRRQTDHRWQGAVQLVEDDHLSRFAGYRKAKCGAYLPLTGRCLGNWEQYRALRDGSSGELVKAIRLPKMRGEHHGKR